MRQVTSQPPATLKGFAIYLNLTTLICQTYTCKYNFIFKVFNFQSSLNINIKLYRRGNDSIIYEYNFSIILNFSYVFFFLISNAMSVVQGRN